LPPPPMRLNFCLGEAWFDEEHIDDYERVEDHVLHPSRTELRHRAIELREFLEEISSGGGGGSGDGAAAAADDGGGQALVTGPPLLTTICRSNRDGYAPRNETAAVEGALMAHLTALGWAGGDGNEALPEGELGAAATGVSHHADPWVMGPIHTGAHEEL
jgi:hypothetical protein